MALTEQEDGPPTFRGRTLDTWPSGPSRPSSLDLGQSVYRTMIQILFGSVYCFVYSIIGEHETLICCVAPFRDVAIVQTVHNRIS